MILTIPLRTRRHRAQIEANFRAERARLGAFVLAVHPVTCPDPASVARTEYRPRRWPDPLWPTPAGEVVTRRRFAELDLAAFEDEP